MAKTKKPAPKGGKKIAAPKKAAKAAPKKGRALADLTERQADQLIADKMRADAFASTQSARQTVEEQWEQSLVEAKNQGKVWAELAAATMSGLDLPASTAPPKKKSLWHRFRSAVSGLFVSKKYAEANPDTTVREKVD